MRLGPTYADTGVGVLCAWHAVAQCAGVGEVLGTGYAARGFPRGYRRTGGVLGRGQGLEGYLVQALP
eukprot:11217763-Lingulodinium_polyedra.AAC.1